MKKKPAKFTGQHTTDNEITLLSVERENGIRRKYSARFSGRANVDNNYCCVLLCQHPPSPDTIVNREVRLKKLLSSDIRGVFLSFFFVFRIKHPAIIYENCKKTTEGFGVFFFQVSLQKLLKNHRS